MAKTATERQREHRLRTAQQLLDRERMKHALEAILELVKDRDGPLGLQLATLAREGLNTKEGNQ